MMIAEKLPSGPRWQKIAFGPSLTTRACSKIAKPQQHGLTVTGGLFEVTCYELPPRYLDSKKIAFGPSLTTRACSKI